MPMALHGKEGGSSSHAMEEGEELRRRGLLLLGTYSGAQQQNELGEAWQEGKKQQRLWEGHPPAWVFDYAGSQKLGFREYFF